MTRLRALKTRLLDIAFPQNNLCLLCSRPLLQGDAALLCDSCRSKLLAIRLPAQRRATRLPWPDIEEARAVFPYAGEARALVVALKYGETRVSAAMLAQCMAQDAAVLRPDVIVPVPLHPRRLKMRGYNQSALLGAELSLLIGVSMQSAAITRTRSTRSQVGKSREQRLRNVRGAFHAEAALVSGLRVLLLDDVCTTGATATACAEALLAAGARSVTLLTACRA